MSQPRMRGNGKNSVLWTETHEELYVVGKSKLKIAKRSQKLKFNPDFSQSPNEFYSNYLPEEWQRFYERK